MMDRRVGEAKYKDNDGIEEEVNDWTSLIPGQRGSSHKCQRGGPCQQRCIIRPEVPCGAAITRSTFNSLSIYLSFIFFIFICFLSS